MIQCFYKIINYIDMFIDKNIQRLIFQIIDLFIYMYSSLRCLANEFESVI